MAAGIYIHIPFCVRKCLYCDFVSRTGSKEDMQRYHRALINEIELTVVKETVDSIFFGGGTPSVYPVEYIEEIIDKLKCRCDVRENSEITIECNPGTLNMDKLYRYRQAGINRISIGLQSCNNEELKKLGRIHTYEEFEHSFIMARDAGFNNINIDIMSAIPDQTIASYKETLHKVVSLRPQHISAYSLIIEEGTPFFSEYGKGSKNENKLPDEDTDREMYHLTKAYLKENGYERYEISNYARSEKECKHNIKYWNRDNYYGFGVSAASLVDNVRYTNISDIINYV
jgi:oxygen-independent coproporphyrinogen-3 oxidase